MRMYCDKCGRLLHPDGDFCSRCDAPDNAASSAAAAVHPAVSAMPAAPAPAMRDLPSGVLAAATLCGITAPLLLALGGLQFMFAVLAVVTGNAAVVLLFGAGWNALLGFCFCAIAYQIARLHRREYDWGLRSGVLNTGRSPLLMAYNAANGAILAVLLQMVLLPLAVASAVLLFPCYLPSTLLLGCMLAL